MSRGKNVNIEIKEKLRRFLPPLYNKKPVRRGGQAYEKSNQYSPTVPVSRRLLTTP
jgi:hypothetical protein